MRFTHDSPKGAAELLDDAVGLYRRNLRFFIGASGLVMFPAGLVLGFGQMAYQVAVAWAAGAGMTSSPEAAQGRLLLTLAAAALLFGLTGLYALLGAFVRAVLMTAGARLHVAERVTVRDAYRLAWQKALPFLITEFLVLLAVGAASIFFLLPGLVVGVFLSVAGIVVLVEDRSLFDALKRSAELVSGRFWRVAGLLAASAGLAWAVQSIITVPSQAYLLVQAITNPGGFLQPGGGAVYTGLLGLMSAIAGVVVAPLTALVTVGLFVDLRLRREGEDLEAAAEALAP